MQEQQKYSEVRIAIAGSVDVGKSSLIGVLTRGILDDGRGAARSHIFKHQHERTTGRTSSITNHFIRHESSDITTLIDLAGHEKYLKTTINGLERGQADYVAVIIGANNGILKMTREHLTITFALNLPTFIIVTKIDMAPEHVLKQTETAIIKLFSNKQLTPYIVRTINDLELMSSSNFPVIEVSSVSGRGLDALRQYMYSLKSKIDYPLLVECKKPVFIIDSTYTIKGIGLVVSGVLRYGCINKGDVLVLGPFRQATATQGGFVEVSVRGIHDNFKNSITQLTAGHGGCLNLKPTSNKAVIKRSNIRNGAVVVKEPYYVAEFEADIKVLHHATTITKNYQPTIHCNGMTQSARILQMDKEYLRNGDSARVKFQFLYRPAFLELGNVLIFREGNTKGIGKIINVL